MTSDQPASDPCVICAGPAVHGGLCCAHRYDEQPPCGRCPDSEPVESARALTTTVLRRQRKLRRTVRRFRQEHPHELRPDSLRSGVDYLKTLRCDDSTTRQGRLPT